MGEADQRRGDMRAWEALIAWTPARAVPGMESFCESAFRPRRSRAS